jgi:hypothetical protein
VVWFSSGSKVHADWVWSRFGLVIRPLPGLSVGLSISIEQHVVWVWHLPTSGRGVVRTCKRSRMALSIFLSVTQDWAILTSSGHSSRSRRLASASYS